MLFIVTVRFHTCTESRKGLTKALVGEVSSFLKKIGCRWVLDEQVRNQLAIQYVNRKETELV